MKQFKKHAILKETIRRPLPLKAGSDPVMKSPLSWRTRMDSIRQDNPEAKGRVMGLLKIFGRRDLSASA